MKTTQQKLLKLPVETEETKVQKYPHFELKTKGGYRLDEAVSALQKAIRRGQEERAMFWAYELFKGGYVKYLWRRLSIIVLEDIGLADPFAAILVNSLAQSSERINKNGYVETLHPGMAVMYLCRAFKSREVDYMLEFVDHKRKLGQKLELLDHDLDCHTQKGREKLRQAVANSKQTYETLVNQQFYYKGALLNKPVTIKNNYWKVKVWELRKLDKKKINLKYED